MADSVRTVILIAMLIIFLGLSYIIYDVTGTNHPALGHTETPTPLHQRPPVWRCLDARDADVRAIVRLAKLGVDEQLLDDYNKRSHDLLLECRDNLPGGF